MSVPVWLHCHRGWCDTHLSHTPVTNTEHVYIYIYLCGHHLPPLVHSHHYHQHHHYRHHFPPQVYSEAELLARILSDIIIVNIIMDITYLCYFTSTVSRAACHIIITIITMTDITFLHQSTVRQSC